MTTTDLFIPISAVPADYPVRPLPPLKPGQTPLVYDEAYDRWIDPRITCGTCGLSWDDRLVGAPSGRCPFEELHVDTETVDALETRLAAVRSAMSVLDTLAARESVSVAHTNPCWVALEDESRWLVETLAIFEEDPIDAARVYADLVPADILGPTR